MSLKLIVFLNILLIAFGTACSTKTETEDIVITDNEVSASKSNEVVFSDKIESGENALNLTNSSFNGNGQSQTIWTKDNSEITTMIDVLGNKTEMRVFHTGQRVASVLVRTAADGRKETFAYDQNGKVKPLPTNIIERAMSASADEIADATGIHSVAAPSISAQTVTPLQPMPSYKFPVRNQPAQQTRDEGSESSEPPPETTQNSNEKGEKLPPQ